LYEQNSNGVFTGEEKVQLKSLEDNKRKLLDWEDSKWRMKNQALWLAQEDKKKDFSKLC
jgi:hypothetical protein